MTNVTSFHRWMIEKTSVLALVMILKMNVIKINYEILTQWNIDTEFEQEEKNQNRMRKCDYNSSIITPATVDCRHPCLQTKTEIKWRINKALNWIRLDSSAVAYVSIKRRSQSFSLSFMGEQSLCSRLSVSVHINHRSSWQTCWQTAFVFAFWHKQQLYTLACTWPQTTSTKNTRKRMPHSCNRRDRRLNGHSS